jgi:hypothetical protein
MSFGEQMSLTMVISALALVVGEIAYVSSIGR